MTPIYMQPIHHPMAWRGEELRSKDDIAFDLSRAQVAALEEILLRVQDRPRGEIRREHASHPALDDALAAILDEVQLGRGVVLIRGIPVEKHPQADVERMFAALCTHFGPVLSQNSLGDRMVLVQEERPPGEDQSPRGNKARQELAMHTDIAEVVGLLCVRKPSSGGESQLASALAVHNEILATRPDLLPILYRGFPYHRRGEQPDDQPLVTPYDVPVFCNIDGQVSCTYIRNIAMAGLHELGRSLSPEELEALNLVRDAAMRLQFEMRMDPGEAYVVNNYTTLHSRSEYGDPAELEQKRLMLRVWIEAARNRRPVPQEMLIHDNEGGRHGVDPVPGRSVTRQDYSGITESARKVLLASAWRSA